MAAHALQIFGYSSSWLFYSSHGFDPTRIPLAVVRLFGDIKPETYRRGVHTTILTLMLFCFLITSFAYFKVYQIIRHHQKRVQEHESSQNFGQPAIDLAK